VSGIVKDSTPAGQRAHAAFKKALRLASQLDDADLITRVCSNYADFAFGMGDFRCATTLWEKAIVVAEQRGFVWHKSFAALSQAWVHLQLGELERARSLTNAALETGEEAQLFRILAAAVGIPLGLSLDDNEMIARCCDEQAIELAFRSGEAQHIGGVVSAFAELWLKQGKLDKIRDLLHRAVVALPSADQAENMLCWVVTHGYPADLTRAKTLLESWAGCRIIGSRKPIWHSSSRAWRRLKATRLAPKRWHVRQPVCITNSDCATLRPVRSKEQPGRPKR
jgi:tetratricopeptide (TPR) repeat protein